MYFGCLDLYFGCPDLYFGRLDLFCISSFCLLGLPLVAIHSLNPDFLPFGGIHFQNPDFSLGGVLERVSAPGQRKNKIWSICSNDYASKTRIEILCKKPVPMPQDVFSQADFFGNSWDDRTLAKMSTSRIEATRSAARCSHQAVIFVGSWTGS